MGAEGRLRDRSGLLLRDGGADAIDKGENEGYVDGAGDFAAMRQVEVCQVGNDLGEGSLGDGGGDEELGLGGHCAMWLGRMMMMMMMKMKI